jgi:hypothetical protein
MPYQPEREIYEYIDCLLFIRRYNGSTHRQTPLICLLEPDHLLFTRKEDLELWRVILSVQNTELTHAIDVIIQKLLVLRRMKGNMHMTYSASDFYSIVSQAVNDFFA